MRFIAFSCLMLAIFAQPTFAQVSDAEIEACHAAPDTRCLTDIGSALVLAQDPPQQGPSGAHLLAQLGRLDAAYAVELRFQKAKGHSEERALTFVRYFIEPYRVAEAIRNGPVDEVLAGDTAIHYSTLELALWRMAGSMSTNTMLGAQPTQDPVTLSILRQVLLQRDGTREQRLGDASILAYVGEVDAVRDIIDSLPVDDSPRTTISQNVARIVGTERILEIYDGMGDIPPFPLARLAEVEDDPGKARALLERAHARALEWQEEKDQVRDLGTVARTAADLGFDDLAISATDDLRTIFRTTSEPNKLGPTRLAAALRAINAPEDEQRAALELAEQAVDRLPERFAGTASANLAGDYLRFGDAETAIRLWERNDPDPDDWARLMSVEMPDDARTLTMAHVERTLSSEDMALFRARRAASRAYQAESDSKKAAIRDEVAALLAAPVPDRTGVGRFYFDHLLKAADRLGDEDLTSRILTLSARHALDIGHAWPILQAAHQHQHFAEARRGNR